jgi:16S rRNA (cytosine967-C5)-methyltransferase
MPISPARAAAFEILLRNETTGAYASELLHSSRFAELSPADHGLLTELVMGVLRWRSVLDKRIAEHSAQPLAKFDVEVLTALRLAAYQLLFLDRIPTHAAVNESVELVKQARKRSAAGMVNAVLRKIGRGTAPPADALSAHPQWLVERWTRTYGADVARKICDYDNSAPKLAIRISALQSNVGTAALGYHQAEGLVGQGIEKDTDTRMLVGQPRTAAPTLASADGQPEAGARIIDSHPSKTAKGGATSTLGSGTLDHLGAGGIRVEPGRLLATAFTVTSGDITHTKAFRERRLIIQDEASQLVALLVGNGNTILDCCAAPGGKTRIIAEQNPDSVVVAMELHPHRAALLRKLVLTGNVRVIAADARQMPLSRRFDRIIVDAPCSGTGTLARNPEIKWRLKAEDIPRLQSYQTEILTVAMNLVAPNGRLVYSTCSLESEENSEVVEKALAANPEFRLIDCRTELQRLRQDHELVIDKDDVESLLSGPYLRTIPGIHPADGFFAAILEKN